MNIDIALEIGIIAGIGYIAYQNIPGLKSKVEDIIGGSGEKTLAQKYGKYPQIFYNAIKTPIGSPERVKMYEQYKNKLPGWILEVIADLKMRRWVDDNYQPDVTRTPEQQFDDLYTVTGGDFEK